MALLYPSKMSGIKDIEWNESKEFRDWYDLLNDFKRLICICRYDMEPRIKYVDQVCIFCLLYTSDAADE